MIGLIAITTTILAALSDAERKRQTTSFLLGGFEGLVRDGHLSAALKVVVDRMNVVNDWPYPAFNEVDEMLLVLNKALWERKRAGRAFHVFVRQHGLLLVDARHEDTSEGPKALRYWPAPGWESEPTQDVYITMRDGDVSSACYSDDEPDIDSDWVIYLLEDLPFTLAEQLLKQGTRDQWFGEEDTAWKEISIYPRTFISKSEGLNS